MDVAIVATPRFPIAQPFAGGLEAHTHILASALARRGHAVTVYAAGGDGDFHVERMLPLDFVPSAVARRDVAAPPATAISEHHAYLDVIMRLSTASHDVVHLNSVHYLPFSSAGLVPAPVVGTLHCPPTPWLESALAIAATRRRPPTLVSVSRSNADSWGPGLVSEVIHNGIDLDAWTPGPGGGGAVWSGRIVPEKAPHLAIDAARAAGLPIVLLGPVYDEAYFAAEVAPRLGPDARHLGHVSCAVAAEIVGAACVALVTPVWDEPFGLVVAEALACGTPVVAFRRGALAELVGPEVGRLVDPGDVAALARALAEVDDIDRDRCRQVAEQNFGSDVMAARYESCFERTIDRFRSTVAA